MVGCIYSALLTFWDCGNLVELPVAPRTEKTGDLK